LAWFGPVTATLSNKTLTAPKVTGTTAVAGTVTVSSADPNVSLDLVSKGTGKVLVNGVEAVGTTSAQSLSNKTLVTPTITGPTISPVTAGPNALALTVGAAQVRANGTNVAFGNTAQRSLTTGAYNTAIGSGAQSNLTEGRSNLGIGANTQSALTTGSDNVAIGVGSQQVMQTGSQNTAIGKTTQSKITTGVGNTAVGNVAQSELTTGSFNVALGDFAQLPVPTAITTTASNQTCVGAKTGQSSATQVDGITTIGYQAWAGAVNGTSLGLKSRADHTDSVALGSNTVTTAANQVMVGPRDVEITDATKGLVLKSPDGSRFRISVDNAGVLSAAKI
jgi:hypothetical protein